MAKKQDNQAEPEQSALEKRVDEMMDPKPKAMKPVPAPSPAPANDSEPIDIFKGQPADVKPVAAATAPTLPGAKRVDDIKPAEAKPSKKITVGADTTEDKAIDIPAKEPAAEAEPDPEPAKKPEASLPVDEPDAPGELVTTELADDATDKAVADIVAHEGDELLAVEDAALQDVPRKAKKSGGGGFNQRLQAILKNKWTWIGVIVVLLVLFGVPATRYKVLGLVLKKTTTVKVIDSKSATPVSNAIVSIGGATAKTDGNGQATLKAAVGSKTLHVTKEYYKDYDVAYFVGLKSSPASTARIVATGRQVPVSVVNTITGKPLAGVEIKVLNTTAKTDKQGKAIVVLPTTKSIDDGTISLTGYNQTKVAIQVTDKVVAANQLKLTPAGQVYFLSNLNGNIDVVKTNLDGTGRKVVLAGTGKEDATSTSLLASRDWRFAVLKSHREGDNVSLTLIDTTTDKTTAFEDKNVDYTLVGWYAHNFIYDILNSSAPTTQAGREVIKSYDADHEQPNQLDQNQVDGPQGGYAYQNFSNFYILNNMLAYTVQWFTYGTYDLSSKNAVIRGVQPNGQGKKDYQTFSAQTTGYIQASLYEPQGLYFSVYDNSSSKTSFYELEDQKVTAANNLNQSDLNKSYPTYLISPGGNQTFWTELRDGKNTLFIGDTDAAKKKQIASLSDYAPYGWYSDNYLLVSKNSSELYIMPVTGSSKPLKVSDYYKPSQNYAGYGYGYGGL